MFKAQTTFISYWFDTCFMNPGILAGGTDRGRVAMWRYSPVPGVLGRRQEGETKWKLQAPCNLEGQLGQIKWGSRRDLLATNSFAGVVILNEHIMSASMKDQVCNPFQSC